MSVTINFDSDGAFSRLASALRSFADTAASELAKSLDAVAAPTLVAGTRARAAQWSKQTPPTITALPATDEGAAASLVVQAGGVPIAYLLQAGAPSKPGGSTWRHPVFGNPNVWVSQKMHPYLEPTAAEVSVVSDAVSTSVTEALGVALDAVDG